MLIQIVDEMLRLGFHTCLMIFCVNCYAIDFTSLFSEQNLAGKMIEIEGEIKGFDGENLDPSHPRSLIRYSVVLSLDGDPRFRMDAMPYRMTNIDDGCYTDIYFSFIYDGQRWTRVEHSSGTPDYQTLSRYVTYEDTKSYFLGDVNEGYITCHSFFLSHLQFFNGMTVEEAFLNNRYAPDSFDLYFNEGFWHVEYKGRCQSVVLRFYGGDNDSTGKLKDLIVRSSLCHATPANHTELRYDFSGELTVVEGLVIPSQLIRTYKVGDRLLYTSINKIKHLRLVNPDSEFFIYKLEKGQFVFDQTNNIRFQVKDDEGEIVESISGLD